MPYKCFAEDNGFCVSSVEFDTRKEAEYWLKNIRAKYPSAYILITND